MAFDEVVHGVPEPLAVLVDLRTSGQVDGGVVPRRHDLVVLGLARVPGGGDVGLRAGDHQQGRRPVADLPPVRARSRHVRGDGVPSQRMQSSPASGMSSLPTVISCAGPTPATMRRICGSSSVAWKRGRAWFFCPCSSVGGL
jgi:hypothetical protein